jgi:hypothetical protein
MQSHAASQFAELLAWSAKEKYFTNTSSGITRLRCMVHALLLSEKRLLYTGTFCPLSFNPLWFSQVLAASKFVLVNKRLSGITATRGICRACPLDKRADYEASAQPVIQNISICKVLIYTIAFSNGVDLWSAAAHQVT